MKHTNSSVTTYEQEKIHFAVMAIESAAHKLCIPAQEMQTRLKKQDLIHKRLLRHYDLLHTQSLDWVADDLIETLNNWEENAWKKGETVK